MSGLFPNQGLDNEAQNVVAKTTQPTFKVHLYTNNLTPSNSTVIGDFTECALSGYAAATLTGSSWSGSTTSGVATYTYPTLTFTFSAYAGGTTIYGYYVENTVTGLLGWAEKFTTSYAVPAGGGQLNLSLSVEVDNS